MSPPAERESHGQLPDRLASTPYWRLLGVRIEELGPGHCRLRMAAHPGIEAFPGRPIHSGALACLVELAAMAAAETLAPTVLTVAATTSLDVRFLAPAAGDVLAEGQAVALEGEAEARGEVRVRDQEGRLVAEGRATCRFRSS